MNFTIFKTGLLFSLLMIFSSCHRGAELTDDFPQEDVSNALLIVKDNADGATTVYNYQINGSNIPNIKLKNNHEYTVQIALKNGAEDANQDIKDAKDEHFFVFDFPNSDIEVIRLDDASSTRNDGNKVGLITKWKINTAAKSGNAQLVLTLYHEPISVSENAENSGNGTVYGIVSGGETDLKVNYQISNF